MQYYLTKFLSITALSLMAFLVSAVVMVTPTHADTPMNVTSSEYLPCTPDCQTLRVHFDSYNYTQSETLVVFNTQSDGTVISGAYNAADFTSTYADFTVPNSDPVWHSAIG